MSNNENITKEDEININNFVKENLNATSEKMISKTNILFDDFKILNKELKELIELESELKQIESSNLNKKNELINLERKLNENNDRTANTE